MSIPKILNLLLSKYTYAGTPSEIEIMVPGVMVAHKVVGKPVPEFVETEVHADTGTAVEQD